MGREQNKGRIELPCKFGTLVCEVVRDDDDYKEIAIDLHRANGEAVQVCVVGTNEREYVDLTSFDERTNATLRESHEKVHIDLWNGEDEDSFGRYFTEPFGEGNWK